MAARNWAGSVTGLEDPSGGGLSGSDPAAVQATARAVTCFLPGTLITTPAANVPVETLEAPDLIVTASGEVRPLVWVGVSHVKATPGQRGPATPVIVRKGALADNVPDRDLRVTNDHGLYLDGVLIPAEALINGRTILWDDQAGDVTVHHLRLKTHDILLANGAPCESDRGNGDGAIAQNDGTADNPPGGAPYAELLTDGPAVEAVRRRLLDRAGPPAQVRTTDQADLHLIVDGARIDGVSPSPGLHVFRVPGQPIRIRLASRSGVPMELGVGTDVRSLGVALRRIMVWRGARVRVVEAADPALNEGFHPLEAEGEVRWTDGDAALPGSLFDAGGGPVVVELLVAATSIYPLPDDHGPDAT